jgi:hypothetical protein
MAVCRVLDEKACESVIPAEPFMNMRASLTVSCGYAIPDTDVLVETRCSRDRAMSGLRSSCHGFPIPRLARLVFTVLSFVLLFAVGAEDLSAKSKQKSAPPREPELKIVNLTISPTPYASNKGPLQFSVIVQLPKEVDHALMLEVSSLVTSPSMTSLRFLSSRQPITDHESAAIISGSASAEELEPKRVRIHLSWDGLDHNKQPAPPGSYEYMVRAKLLRNGEKGQKTQMSSWPKRGSFLIK